MAIPADKNKVIRGLQSEIMETNVESSIRVNRCVSCSYPARDFKDEISRREFAISGLCQECQDIAFAPLDEKEEED